MKYLRSGMLFQTNGSGSDQVRYRIGVGCETSAQSDALRDCGDAAHPARQKSRPARRRAVINRLRCPTPDNRRRGVAKFSRWAAETLFGTGKPAREPEVPPPICFGDHGKGGLVGRSLLGAA